MVPTAQRQWRSWGDVADAFVGRPDPDWERDRALLDGSVTDPWEPRQ